MPPTVVIYGGVHGDPGSRRQLIEKLAERASPPPAFVAVEANKALHAQAITERSRAATEIEGLWSLTRQDCEHLAKAIAWEGDAFRESFPDAPTLWLDGETLGDVPEGPDAPEAWRGVIVSRVRHAREMSHAEWLARLAGAPRTLRAEPRSLQELIDRLWTKLWFHLEPEGPEAYLQGWLEREASWERLILDRLPNEGWAAAVVGLTHARLVDTRRLPGRLEAAGVQVACVELGPPGGTTPGNTAPAL